MIAEFIPAWTAGAIHFRMLKEILCAYHDPKVKADQVRACLVFRKVAEAKPSVTAALCEDFIRFHSATALTLQASDVSMINGSLSNS